VVFVQGGAHRGHRLVAERAGQVEAEDLGADERGDRSDVDGRGGYTWNGEWHEKLLPALHPVVRTHPENGRNGLFVNQQFTQTILGLSKNESNAILEMLYRHCQQPEYTCRFRWHPGSVAFWDNRATLHYALDDYGSGRRFAHRVTLRGDVPFGPDQPRRS